MQRRRPHRSGVLPVVTLISAVGLLTGMAASRGVGPFAAINTGAHQSSSATAIGRPLGAADLYPSPPVPMPMVRTVVVQDPPPRPYVQPPAAREQEAPGSSSQESGSECDDGCSSATGGDD